MGWVLRIMTRAECFIGCPACKTVLFRVDSVERAGKNAKDHTGIFEHELVALTDPAADDHQKCACGKNLERAEGPKE